MVPHVPLHPFLKKILDPPLLAVILTHSMDDYIVNSKGHDKLNFEFRFIINH
jgi:hypothetical protein